MARNGSFAVAFVWETLCKLNDLKVCKMIIVTERFNVLVAFVTTLVGIR